jgi:hypothetical protein
MDVRWRLTALNPPVIMTILQYHRNIILLVKIHPNPVDMITLYIHTIGHVLRTDEVFARAD